MVVLFRIWEVGLYIVMSWNGSVGDRWKECRGIHRTPLFVGVQKSTRVTILSNRQITGCNCPCAQSQRWSFYVCYIIYRGRGGGDIPARNGGVSEQSNAHTRTHVCARACKRPNHFAEHTPFCAAYAHTCTNTRTHVRRRAGTAEGLGRTDPE